MANKLEIIPDPANDSHYVLQGGQQIARFNSIEKAEAFVQSQLALIAEEKITEAKLCVNNWAGRREYPVEVLAETDTQLEIRMLSDGLLPRGHVKSGQIIKVPRDAVTGFERSQKIEEQELGMEL
jgi:hypothetical protein